MLRILLSAVILGFIIALAAASAQDGGSASAATCQWKYINGRWACVTPTPSPTPSSTRSATPTVTATPTATPTATATPLPQLPSRLYSEVVAELGMGNLNLTPTQMGYSIYYAPIDITTDDERAYACVYPYSLYYSDPLTRNLCKQLPRDTAVIWKKGQMPQTTKAEFANILAHEARHLLYKMDGPSGDPWNEWEADKAGCLASWVDTYWSRCAIIVPR